MVRPGSIEIRLHFNSCVANRMSRVQKFRFLLSPGKNLLAHPFLQRAPRRSARAPPPQPEALSGRRGPGIQGFEDRDLGPSPGGESREGPRMPSCLPVWRPRRASQLLTSGQRTPWLTARWTQADVGKNVIQELRTLFWRAVTGNV